MNTIFCPNIIIWYESWEEGNSFGLVLEKSEGREIEVAFGGGREKIDQLFSNHALESDDKEESEYASPMIVKLLSLSLSLPNCN